MQAHSPAWKEVREQLVRFVRRRVGDTHAAEDIVQDVLLRAYARHDEVREPLRLRQWLYRSTRNAVVDYYRTRRPSEPLPPSLTARAEEPEEARTQLARCLRPLLSTLPARYREALELSEVQGHSQKETARLLGLSLSGAKSRVQRGRAQLEQALHACCRIELDGRRNIAAFEARRGCKDRRDATPRTSH